MKRLYVLILFVTVLALGGAVPGGWAPVGTAGAQAPIESELVLITPVSRSSSTTPL